MGNAWDWVTCYESLMEQKSATPGQQSYSRRESLKWLVGLFATDFTSVVFRILYYGDSLTRLTSAHEMVLEFF